LTLTDAGDLISRRASVSSSRSTTPKKKLRSSVELQRETSPSGLGHLYLLPLLCEFLKVYPDIVLRLLLSDRVLNPVENKIDFAIRIGLLPDSSIIATRIGSARIVACASPDTLLHRGL
jgi:DNA-binding transcriptional LysR family regulator